MAVLSNSEILRRIGLGTLVPNADRNLVSECSYSFVPGAAFHPGREEAPIIFPDEVVVRPGEMIWIRTREQVSMPCDLAGFWWQTNSLSRRGLMLVNMSMIEPGYEGDLACLFVNFGKSTIPINGATIVAKMVFMTVEGAVADPFDGRLARGDYDARLRELSIDQPPSFLQVGELVGKLTQDRDAAIQAIKAQAGDAAQAAKAAIGEDQAARIQALADARDAATRAISDKREDELKTFRGDIKTSIQTSFGWAAAALVFLTLGTVGANWIKGNLFPDVPVEARKAADLALRDRMTISAAAQPTDSAQLTAQLKRLDARIAALEKTK
jgi:deoxycytidine triphosphate deaminase